ncbi:MAG: BamA/TamA family outer membrane protein [Candidatus Krumholzibacteriota bacterium]|nr:BamA/TamA family outer membrane protein [Candidatus Krumholzibacteriota bacterium]
MLLAISALVAVFYSSEADAQPASYRIWGNEIFSDGEIIKILRTAGWKPGADVGRLVALQEAYYREGHLLAVVSVDDSAAVVLIDEGEVARVESVRINGAVAIDERDIVTTLGFDPGDPFRPRELTARMDRLLRRYDEKGYPFVQLWFDSIGHDALRNRIHIRVTLVEGSPRIIARVQVDGLERTKPDVAVRVSGITPGSSYSRAVLDDAYLRMVSSRLFDRVEYPTVRMSADGQGVDAVIKVVEPKRAHSFRAAIGYAAAESEEEDRILSGFVDLRLKNIGGTLKDFDAFWTNDGQERSETRLAYYDRFFLGRQLTVGLRLEQIGQDTLYTWQSLGMELEKPVGRAGSTLFSLSAGIYADRNIFSTGDIRRSRRYRVGLGVGLLRGNWRHTDFYELDAKFTWARKRTTWREPEDSTASLNQYILEAKGEATTSFGRLLHGRVAGEYHGLDSPEELVPLSEQFYIGGARTLRGYKENQFHGRRVGTLSTELLVGPGRWENGYLFVDMGYVFQETPQVDGMIARENVFPIGFGLGLRTESPVGNIDLSFAVDGELSLEQTKVHVLLEQNF